MKLSYKDLHLIFALIKPTLEEFAEGQVQEEKKGMAWHFVFQKKGQKGRVIAYKKDKGTITLDAAGKDKELSEEAILYVIEKTKLTEKKNFSLSIKGYGHEKYTLLQEYLVEECKASINESYADSDESQITKIRGTQGDILTLTLYGNGTLRVQGRPLLLALDVINYLADDKDINQEEILQYLSEIFDTKTTSREANKELSRDYPHAFEFAGPNLKKILSTAISMQGLPLVVEDYSVISSQALRALESFMKKAVLKATEENWSDFSGVFDKNRQSSSEYELKKEVRDKIICGITCELLEKCYRYYNKQRHGTFHAGAVDEGIRIIEDRTEALEISRTSLQLMDKYSKLLNEKE